MSSGNRGILQVFRRAAKKAKNFSLFTKRSSFEGFFASKGAAYALPDGDFARQATNKHGGEMQLHLQAMVNLLRDEDVLRLVIKLESQSPNRIRYLTIVSAFGPDEEEQSIVMGVDWTDKATIGLVVPVYRDTTIKLDGDGGFHMISSGRQHIFKPISVQTMWTALQWIHKCSDNARKNNYFYPNGSSHAWADYYYRKISSDRVCVNEWEQMDDIESKRPESPIGTSTEKELIMKLIRHKLKEVMTRVDLEDVTCRQIRMMLEEETQMELKEYRSFIDEEMIIILGQMDSASHIFDHVYLGSEWNASNLEELKENGVGYILNITREIDNFFPGTFHYYNIRVYDLDETELLHHWDNTYRFIQRAKDAGSKVLVHCRMGISRSASTVIAYGMKEYGWSLGETMKYVKGKRNVVQPNAGFWKQLITYEGILNSSKQRYNRLFRHSSFCTEEGDLPKSSGAVKKRREKSPSSAEQLPEGLDTVDNIPLETEDIKSSDDSLEELRVLQETLEDTEDLCLPEDTYLESGNADSMLATSSPIVPCPEATVETSGEVFEETNSVPLSSSASEISVVERISLQRVRSVPSLPSDDKKGQESDDESTGNFRRSRSLRERNTKKLQNLRIVTKGRSASDENLKEFERKKREILGYEETEARDAQETENFEKESRGSLPSDLDGVLESGFVKRHSRKFEEGVCYAPELDENVDLTKTEEMEVECLPEDIKEKEINREEQVEDESMPSEEPEPGVVRKHKEGYELKHRESLKRRAMLQRDGSGEGKSAKREEDEIEDVSDIDADAKLPQAIEGLEDEVRGVSVEALVKKVNEDMKKEVSVRRISASMKEQELRAFVQKAGEQMREALTSGEDEDKSVLNKLDSEQVGEASNTGSMKRKTRVLVFEEDVQEPSPGDCQLTELSSERMQPDASKYETKGPTENTELVKPSLTENVSAGVEITEKSSVDGAEASKLLETVQDKEEGQETEDAPPKGLVKRHTLLIEGKLQPWEQELEKPDCEKENELAVEREVPLSHAKGERKSEATDNENAKGTNKQEETVKQVTPERVATSEVSQDNKDAGSDNDTESVLQKGLVKRHTLLIEGKLQPLDQEFKQECELSPGDQGATLPSPKGETNRPSSHVEQAETDVVQGQGNNNPEKAETLHLSEDSKNIDSDKDTEDLPQKGVVKWHTLLLEGRLQPLEQELAKNAENEGRKETEPVVNQDSEICTDSEKVKVIDAPNESAVVEPVESSVVNSEETRELTEDIKDVGSEKDAESVQKGLVKRHTLLIEGRLQPLDQELDKDVEKEDGKEDEITFDNEASLLSSYEQEQLRYQIERTDDSTAEQCEEENEDSENVSGLVKREKLRIEERLQTTVADPKQEAEDSVVCNVSSASGAVEELEELCLEADSKEEEDEGLEKLMGEEELSEVAVDTSSVVRVKAHTQHLEGILRVKQDVEKVKRQTSKEDVSKSKDEGPKFFIVPRSSSDESIDDNTTENLHEDKMNVLSDSAVNIALFKAQENLDAEKESVELENKIDWDVANVKQRTQIFEDMRPKGDKESKSNPLRRQESMPKMVRVDEIPPMRRRSVSDVTSTASSGSSREVGYTIVFKNRVMGSSSASSLPRDWSPLEIRKRQEDKGELLTKEVFSPEINEKDKLKRNTSVEIIKRHDSDNDESCVNVKETIQVLDSKNQKNISNC